MAWGRSPKSRSPNRGKSKKGGFLSRLVRSASPRKKCEQENEQVDEQTSEPEQEPASKENNRDLDEADVEQDQPSDDPASPITPRSSSSGAGISHRPPTPPSPDSPPPSPPPPPPQSQPIPKRRKSLSEIAHLGRSKGSTEPSSSARRLSSMASLKSKFVDKKAQELSRKSDLIAKRRPSLGFVDNRDGQVRQSAQMMSDWERDIEGLLQELEGGHEISPSPINNSRNSRRHSSPEKQLLQVQAKMKSSLSFGRDGGGGGGSRKDVSSSRRRRHSLGSSAGASGASASGTRAGGMGIATTRRDSHAGAFAGTPGAGAGAGSGAGVAGGVQVRGQDGQAVAVVEGSEDEHARRERRTRRRLARLRKSYDGEVRGMERARAEEGGRREQAREQQRGKAAKARKERRKRRLEDERWALLKQQPAVAEMFNVLDKEQERRDVQREHAARIMMAAGAGGAGAGVGGCRASTAPRLRDVVSLREARRYVSQWAYPMTQQQRRLWQELFESVDCRHEERKAQQEHARAQGQRQQQGQQQLILPLDESQGSSSGLLHSQPRGQRQAPAHQKASANAEGITAREQQSLQQQRHNRHRNRSRRHSSPDRMLELQMQVQASTRGDGVSSTQAKSPAADRRRRYSLGS